MYHSKILVSWLSSKSAYPELAYIIGLNMVHIRRINEMQSQLNDGRSIKSELLNVLKKGMKQDTAKFLVYQKLDWQPCGGNKYSYQDKQISFEISPNGSDIEYPMVVLWFDCKYGEDEKGKYAEADKLADVCIYESPTKFYSIWE